MKMLTVFYDADCGICTGFRRWMMKEPAHLAIEFLPYTSRKAGELCPGLLQRGAEREIIVMADDGRLWQGAEAWVTCLWALRRWRGWSKRLANPALLPVAEKLCKRISTNRLTLSRLLHLRSDREIAGAVNKMAAVACPHRTSALERAKLAVRKEKR
ncbi:MAG: DUF393 domain-containing protein [Roseibacillus sp.]